MTRSVLGALVVLTVAVFAVGSLIAVERWRTDGRAGARDPEHQRDEGKSAEQTRRMITLDAMWGFPPVCSYSPRAGRLELWSDSFEIEDAQDLEIVLSIPSAPAAPAGR
jgi:hypothetical protein